MHRGLIEHPIAGDMDGNMIDGRPKKTIGSWVSTIYEAVRDGSLHAELFGFLEQRASAQAELSHNATNGTKAANGTNKVDGMREANGLKGARKTNGTNGPTSLSSVHSR